MNCDTGELRRMANLEDEPEEFRKIFTRVPEELEEAAKRKLNGSNRAFVSLTSGGKLSKFAAKERKKKRKAEKAARRNGRKK